MDYWWGSGGGILTKSSQDDKDGGADFCWNSATKLWETVDAGERVDIGYSGPHFTWSNSQERKTLVQERLDRFWC